MAPAPTLEDCCSCRCHWTPACRHRESCNALRTRYAELDDGSLAAQSRGSSRDWASIVPGSCGRSGSFSILRCISRCQFIRVLSSRSRRLQFIRVLSSRSRRLQFKP